MFIYTLGTTANKSTPITTELPVQVLSPVPSTVPDESDHPYEKFLSGQEERKLEGLTCCQESQNRPHHNRNARKQQQKRSEPGPGPGQLVTQRAGR